MWRAGTRLTFRGVKTSLWLVSVCLALPAAGWAKPPAKGKQTVKQKKPPALAPTAEPAPSGEAAPSTPAPAPASEVTRVDTSAPPEAAVAQLNSLYTNLEYDKVIPAADALLKRSDLTLEQQLEVYRLQGSAKAIVEDPVDAEKPFRLLLRARPDYDLPANTPPKILSVFRKVQVEEQALAGKLKEVERARIITSLKLLDELPVEAKGGKPLHFSLRLRDPQGAVEAVRVPYRRAGEKTYSSLALKRGEEGDWRGAIPGEFTASKDGFQLEYFVETADAQGPLLVVGAELTPRQVIVAPGLVETKAHKPVHRAAFWTSAAVTVALGLAAGALGLAFGVNQAQYRELASSGGEVDGAVLAQKAQAGSALAAATNASLIACGVGAVTTAVLWPLTDFSGD